MTVAIIWMICVIILQVVLTVLIWNNDIRLTRLEKTKKSSLLPAKLKTKGKVIPYVAPIRKNK